MEKMNYSKEEAALVIGLSKHTISRDIRLGKIQVRHYGRRVLIPREEVIRLAQGDAEPEQDK